jgi:dTMP kinase
MIAGRGTRHGGRTGSAGGGEQKAGRRKSGASGLTVSTTGGRGIGSTARSSPTTSTVSSMPPTSGRAGTAANARATAAMTRGVNRITIAPVAGSILHRFAVLEGLDGSGTTTQLRLAGRRLEREGVPHFLTWEPTDGPVGTLIRSILRHEVPAEPCTVAMLYAADRSEHLHGPGGILERASRGELVLSDRYLFSSLAYQSLECPEEQVAGLNAGFPLPELLVFVDTRSRAGSGSDTWR